MFNLSPKWNFPSNNHSQIIGIADSGVEMFKGTPIKSLAREICQNSLDARLDNAHPARLEFETFTIIKSSFQSPQHVFAMSCVIRLLDSILSFLLL